MSKYVRIKDGMKYSNDNKLMGFANDIVETAGVVDKSGGDFQVQAQVSPNMSVRVRPGTIYIENSSWVKNGNETHYYQCFSTETENLNINSNSSGSTRVDLVCAKIDKVISPGDYGELAFTLVIVEGELGAGVPATPANHQKLAEITVASGATSITSGNITDRRVDFAIKSDSRLNDYIRGDGWITAGETWTYASATTVTIPGDLRSKYFKGMKVKLTQTSVKYFVIALDPTYSSPNTTLTLHPYNSTTSVANAAITNNFYSSADKPSGFPAKPKVRAYFNSTALTNLTSGADVKCVLDGEDFDIGSNFATGTFTAPCAGYYQIFGQIVYTETIADKRYDCRIFKNGVVLFKTAVNLSFISAAFANIGNIVYLAKGDTIELYANQSSGANTVDVVGDLTNTQLIVSLIEH